MKGFKLVIAVSTVVFFGAVIAASAAEKVPGAEPAPNSQKTLDGRTLFMSEKYKCFTCHGEHGEGGRGPSFVGVGKRLSNAELTKHAAHNCPPSGACSPTELAAIVKYLRTL